MTNNDVAEKFLKQYQFSSEQRYHIMKMCCDDVGSGIKWQGKTSRLSKKAREAVIKHAVAWCNQYAPYHVSMLVLREGM